MTWWQDDWRYDQSKISSLRCLKNEKDYMCWYQIIHAKAKRKKHYQNFLRCYHLFDEFSFGQEMVEMILLHSEKFLLEEDWLEQLRNPSLDWGFWFAPCFWVIEVRKMKKGRFEGLIFFVQCEPLVVCWQLFLCEPYLWWVLVRWTGDERLQEWKWWERESRWREKMWQSEKREGYKQKK